MMTLDGDLEEDEDEGEEEEYKNWLRHLNTENGSLLGVRANEISFVGRVAVALAASIVFDARFF